MKGFVEGKEGTSFREETGKLYVFSHREVAVMVAWPPRAWRKSVERPFWNEFRPDIRLPVGNLERGIERLSRPAEEEGQFLLPFQGGPGSGKKGSELARMRWALAIPVGVRRLVTRFSRRQWHMLSFLSRCGEAALDLTRANPALAWALASNWLFHRPPVRQPLRSARALVGRGVGQREILAWLGFPGTEPVRKILAKVVPRGVSEIGLLCLRDALGDASTMKLLSHLPRLNAGALRILTDPTLLAGAAPSLVTEVAQRRGEDGRPKAAYVLRDCITMHGLLHPRARRRLAVPTLRRLHDLHDELVEELNGRVVSEVGLDLPPPPVPGTDLIVPLTNSRDLVEEGRLQNNCVASYVSSVATQGRTYVYRVLAPERCTLSLGCYAGVWLLRDLKRERNQPPSRATRRLVARWLAEQAAAGAPCRPPRDGDGT